MVCSHGSSSLKHGALQTFWHCCEVDQRYRVSDMREAELSGTPRGSQGQRPQTWIIYELQPQRSNRVWGAKKKKELGCSLSKAKGTSSEHGDGIPTKVPLAAPGS